MPEPMRAPPRDEDAERSVLGAILMKYESCTDIIAELSQDSFYFPDHSRVFAAIRALFLKSSAIDAVLVHEQLRRDGQPLPSDWIVGLLESVPSASHANHYKEIVIDLALKRAVIREASDIVGNSYNGTPGATILDNATERFGALSDAATERCKPVEMLDGLRDVAEHMDAMRRGLDDGSLIAPWPDMVEMLRFYPEDLVVIAGRPSMGKTSFALNMARIWAERNIPGAFFSIETQARILFTNLLAAESRIPPNVIRAGVGITTPQYDQLHDSIDKIKDYPISIIDSSTLTLADVRNQCKKLKQAGKLKWAMIDYLQLMEAPEAERRDLEVAKISRGLKLIARDLEIPVIALAQIGRLSERRGKDKRPILSDVKESGGIEQDADIVLLLHRESYYNPGEEDDGTTNVIIAKQRNGPTGEVEMTFLKHFLRFEQKARD
jgi:replicative DNA helicase